MFLYFFYFSLYKFTQVVGWRLIFDLNVLLRKKGSAFSFSLPVKSLKGFQWDESNARLLLKYAEEKNYTNIRSLSGRQAANLYDSYQSVTSRLETSRYRDFSQFFESIGLGLEKKFQYRSRKYLV